jgi:hypothetical protein
MTSYDNAFLGMARNSFSVLGILPPLIQGFSIDGMLPTQARSVAHTPLFMTINGEGLIKDVNEPSSVLVKVSALLPPSVLQKLLPDVDEWHEASELPPIAQPKSRAPDLQNIVRPMRRWWKETVSPGKFFPAGRKGGSIVSPG